VNKLKCTYCGEAEGTEKIANPNLDMGEDIDWSDNKNWWMVCIDCKDTIHAQQGLSIAHIMKDEKYAQKCQAEIEAISKRTKKPVLSATIFKKKDGTYDSVSVEYTGQDK
jgi:aspartate carbamoyltransferase regulatory subunit